MTLKQADSPVFGMSNWMDSGNPGKGLDEVDIIKSCLDMLSLRCS